MIGVWAGFRLPLKALFCLFHKCWGLALTLDERTLPLHREVAFKVGPIGMWERKRRWDRISQDI